MDPIGNVQCGDPNGKSMVASREEIESMAEYKIPSRAEHNLLIHRIWKHCLIASLVLFVVTGGTVLFLFMKGYDSKSIINVSTAIFQVIVLSYGMGFFVPAFLSSLIKMHLGLEMSRMSVNVLDKMDKGINERLLRVDRILDTAEKPDSHPLMKEAKQAALDIKAEVGNLTKEVKRVADVYTKPLVPPKRLENQSGPAGKANGDSSESSIPALRG